MATSIPPIDTGVIGTAENASTYFVSWGLFITILWGFSKSDAGKRITYYVLWLMIVLLVVTHIPAITSIFTQGGILSQKQSQEILSTVTPPSTLR